MHVVEEESTELILGVDVRPGNRAESEQTAPLLEEIVKDTGVEIDELVGDMTPGDSDTRSAVEATGAKMIAKVPPAMNLGSPKTDFVRDPEAPSATCPAGSTTTDARPERDHKGRPTQRLHFAIEVCSGCALCALHS